MPFLEEGYESIHRFTIPMPGIEKRMTLNAVSAAVSYTTLSGE
jgi:hypothetical protein